MSSKSDRMAMRCTEQQKDQWELAAELLRRSMSDWAALSLDAEAEKIISDASDNDVKSARIRISTRRKKDHDSLDAKKRGGK